MFAYQAARTATSALSTELFPTAIRATGYSLCVQVIGQICWMLSPIVDRLALGTARRFGQRRVALRRRPADRRRVAVLVRPETRGKTLEEIALPAKTA